MTDDALIKQRILDFVGGGRVEFGDLYEWAEASLDGLPGLARSEDLTPFEYLELLLDDEPRLLATPDGYVRLDVLLDSLVFTHRLSADEIARSILFSHPDLAVLDWDGTEQFATPGGQPITNPVRDLAYDGPPGWLHDFSDGDVVAVTRKNGVMSIERAPDQLATSLSADVRTAFEALAGMDGSPVQSLPDVVLEVAHEVDGAFRVPVAPLADLIARAGLATQGDEIAEAGTDFSETGPVITGQRLQATAERWAMDACCTDRLQSLLDMIEAQDAADPRAIVEAMGHEVVVLGLRDMLQGSGALGSEDLEAWLDVAVEGSGRRAAPALALRAFHHELNGDADRAEADLERAHALAPEYGPASVELAMYLTMRGEFKRAVSVLNTIGSDGSAIAELFAGVHMDATGVGRNDPCPCGSGRKYKSCHLGKPLATPAAIVDMLLLKLRMFVTDLWRGASGLPVLALMAADGDPQGVGNMYNDDFLQSLAIFEGKGVDDFLGRLGALLPPDELLLAESWTNRKLCLYEISAKEPSARVRLTAAGSGDQFVVEDEELTELGTVGSQILTWLVPSGDGLRIAAPVLSVGDGQVDDVMALVEDDTTTSVDWAAWYGSQTGEPGDD